MIVGYPVLVIYGWVSGFSVIVRYPAVTFAGLTVLFLALSLPLLTNKEKNGEHGYCYIIRNHCSALCGEPAGVCMGKPQFCSVADDVGMGDCFIPADVPLWEEWNSDRSFNGIFRAAVGHRAVSDGDTFVLYDWSKHRGSNTAIPKWNILCRSD